MVFVEVNLANLVSTQLRNSLYDIYRGEFRRFNKYQIKEHTV
jgi:hypothetical protein